MKALRVPVLAHGADEVALNVEHEITRGPVSVAEYLTSLIGE